MQQQLIGAIIDKPRLRKQVGRALGSGGLDVEFAKDKDELAALDAKRPFGLIMVELDAARDVPALIEQVSAIASGRPVMLLSFGQDHEPLLEVIRRNDIANVVSSHGASRAAAASASAAPADFDERELLVTCKKVLSRDIFGIDKYVGAWGAKLHEVTVKSMAEKAAALEGVEALLKSLRVAGTVIPDIVNVADELLLNAIVHAPLGADGKPKYEDIGPVKTLTLEPNEYVSLVYGCDGQRLMLGVADNFGRLKRETLYKYVSKGFAGEKLSPEDKVSGAGLGLTLAFRSIHQLICNVQVGARTEIIAGWYLQSTSAVEFRAIGKSFNMFWL